MKPQNSMTKLTPGQYLVQCRVQRGLTQQALADALGVKTQAVSSWERDVAPVPKHRIMGLRKLIGLNGTLMVDIMTAHYRARLVEEIKKGA